MPVGNHTLPSEVLNNCDGMFYCFAVWANTVTSYTFWTFMLLGFCVAIYAATSRLGSVRAFGYASFVGMVGAIWFVIAQLMPWWTASAFIITGIIGIVMMIMAGRG